MAKNIRIAGGIYNNVPAIELNNADGGTVRFFDVTDTTAEAADVAAGKLFYTHGGILTFGTASQSGATAEEKDVNFYDYDGKCVYSYTVSDFMQLTSMPSVPSHSGMNSSAWNYTLENAKSKASSQGSLKVGVFYTTSTGMRIEVYEDGSNVVPLFNYNAQTGGAGVPWGASYYSGSGNDWGYYTGQAEVNLSSSFDAYSAIQIYASGSSSYPQGKYARTAQPVAIPSNASKLVMHVANPGGLTCVMGLLPTSATTPYKKYNVSQLVSELTVSEAAQYRKTCTLDISAYAGGTYYVVFNAYKAPNGQMFNAYLTSAWIE